MQRVRTITTRPLHSTSHATPELSDGVNAKRLSRYFCCDNVLSPKWSAYNRCGVDGNRCWWLLFSGGSAVYLVPTECLLAKRRKTHKSHVIVSFIYIVFTIYTILLLPCCTYISLYHSPDAFFELYPNVRVELLLRIGKSKTYDYQDRLKRK